MNRFLVCAGTCVVLACTGLADERSPVPLAPGVRAVPTKIGQLTAENTVATWLEYEPHRPNCQWQLLFDCFEPDVDDQCPPPNGDGYDGEPIGWGSCGQGEPEDCDGMRWYFGATYCNMYTNNDMRFDPDVGNGFAERIELGWYWHVRGAGTGENMAIAVEFYEDFDDTCQRGDPDGPGEYLGGVVANFGYTEGDVPGFTYADIDLCGLRWLPLPRDGAGSYKIWILSYEPDEPAWPDEYDLATCAQPMLWGTGDAEPDDRPGTQGAIQWDDDFPVDGWHDAPDECYDYTFGLCPDPLGAAFCFWVDTGGSACTGDLDGDNKIDQRDLGILLADWGCTGPDCVGDIDDDGRTGQSDLGAMLTNWDSRCG